jgi:hypothetical protein
MMPRAVVCVPARNEERRIATLLRALADQDVPGPVHVVLCVNNSTDATEDAARSAAGDAGERLQLRIISRQFPHDLAHAGSARRAAMDAGADWMDDDAAVLVSTDADCRPPHDWLSSNLANAAPDRIVGGRIEFDEAEAANWPMLFALRRRFDLYWSRVRAIEDAVDPVPWDPPPRHGDHTGASLALGVGLYRAAGGVPLIPSGEDRALVGAAVAAGGKLVHPNAVWTRTSPRPDGRAAGGMAEEMARWLSAGLQGSAPRVPAYRHWHSRALWRRSLRLELSPGVLTITEADLPPMPCEMPLPAEGRT